MNKLFLKIALMLLLFLPFANTFAKEKNHDAFFSILQQAIENNDKIKAANANLQAAKEKISQNRAALLPELSLEYNSNINREWWRGGSDSSNPENLSFSLSVPVVNQKSWRAYQQAFPYVAAIELDLQRTIQQNNFAVISEIIAVIQARQVAKLSKNNVTVTKRHMEATSYRHSVGELTVTEQSRAISRHATANANWIESQNQAHIAFARLEEVVGSRVDKRDLWVPNPQKKLFQLPIMSTISLLEKRFDVMAAKNRVEEAKRNHKSLKAGHYPTISINSEAARTWDQDSATYPGVNDSLALEFEVKLPLYSGGVTNSKETQAKFERKAKQAILDEIRKGAKRELQQATFELKSAQAKEKALTTAVAAAKETLDGIKQEFQVGTRTSLDLLDTQQELFTAQTSLIKSHYSLILAKYKILEAVNQLSLLEIKEFSPNSNAKKIDKINSDHKNVAKKTIKTLTNQQNIDDNSSEILFVTIIEDVAISDDNKKINSTAKLKALPKIETPINALPKRVLPKISYNWTVQVTATKIAKSANIFLKKIDNCACSPYIIYFEDAKGQEWYKVRFGKYETKDSAQIAANSFTNTTGFKAWVTKR
ncbi:MAG: TolC family outer membrane protein [Magnetococcales bacterium]|nr:TolC family outer membrane protein [Magnetococcales bacterium]